VSAPARKKGTELELPNTWPPAREPSPASGRFGAMGSVSSRAGNQAGSTKTKSTARGDAKVMSSRGMTLSALGFVQYSTIQNGRNDKVHRSKPEANARPAIFRDFFASSCFMFILFSLSPFSLSCRQDRDGGEFTDTWDDPRRSAEGGDRLHERWGRAGDEPTRAARSAATGTRCGEGGEWEEPEAICTGSGERFAKHGGGAMASQGASSEICPECGPVPGWTMDKELRLGRGMMHVECNAAEDSVFGCRSTLGDRVRKEGRGRKKKKEFKGGNPDVNRDGCQTQKTNNGRGASLVSR
jgi:hypothetical protein